jgi:hypothetical protein
VTILKKLSFAVAALVFFAAAARTRVITANLFTVSFGRAAGPRRNRLIAVT